MSRLAQRHNREFLRGRARRLVRLSLVYCGPQRRAAWAAEMMRIDDDHPLTRTPSRGRQWIRSARTGGRAEEGKLLTTAGREERAC